MQGRRALSLNTYFNRRRCEFAAEEIIIKEIRKVEIGYSYYTREQKRSLVRQCLQYLSRAARSAVRKEHDDQKMDSLMHRALAGEALHQFPAESGESHYHGQNDNHLMEVEQPPVQPGITLSFLIEVSSEHVPPSPIYTARFPGQETDSVDEDPKKDFDWLGNEG
ncbi:hypothetical protein CsSME_00008013 [Camellia sinensis var. sinensis]